MAASKVPDDALRAYLDAGHTQAQASRHFGVSEAAIYQRLKRQNGRNARVLALEHAGTVVEQKLDGSQRLARVQAVIDAELSWAIAEARRPGADRSSLQDAILRLAGEVRQQLGLQLQISRALVDVKLIREFQEVVLDVIRAEEPAVGRRIIERLQARRALRPSADLPGITGSADHAALG
jgi:hypothetical protein